MTDAATVSDLDALAWQIELGADEAICDQPVNRLDQEAAARAEAMPGAGQGQGLERGTVRGPEPQPPRAPQGPNDAGAAVLAAGAGDLAALRQAMAGFEGCALKRGARNTVFADGNPEARVMIIGEAPGREEDQAGKPFVGRSGQLLDRMLAAIGLDRASDIPDRAAYITNVLPWRPPQNRDPSTDEALMMRAFLMRHIDLAAPEILVTMGNPATKTVLDVATGITRMRGTWARFEAGHGAIPVLPMLHPAALLRNPAQKRDAWADLLTLKARLDGTDRTDGATGGATDGPTDGPKDGPTGGAEE